MENLELYIMLIPTIIGSASLIVAGLEKFVKITKTTEDDKAVAKLRKFLDVVSRIALNPKK